MSGGVCYNGDAVLCSAQAHDNPVTFYAFEWVNSRFSKKIKKIDIRSTAKLVGLKGSDKKIIENNAIILIAISGVKKREVPEIQPAK